MKVDNRITKRNYEKILTHSITGILRCNPSRLRKGRKYHHSAKQRQQYLHL